MPPTIGRIVHVNISRDPDHPALRPAIITAVWSDYCVNVRLFLDGANDQPYLAGLGVASTHFEAHPEWLTSIERSLNDTVAFRQWCWPTVSK